MLIRKNQLGFTLVEITVALGLMALGGLALMATGQYFLSSRLVQESRSAHTELRNLIQIALSQKVTTCPGGPSTCVTVNNCSNNLKGKTGSPLKIPASKLASNEDILATDRVEVAVYAGTTLLSVSGKREDHLKYDLLFTGELKSRGTAQSVYSGAVELTGARSFLGRSDRLTAQIPIEITVDNGSGRLIDCIARPNARALAGGSNTVDDCLSKGGMTVPSSLGNLCRFRRPQPFSDEMGLLCPDAFIGDPKVGCVLDPSAESPLLETIPPCPAATITSGCPDGFYRPGTTGSCIACSTPAVSGTATYTSSGGRTAPTDCAVNSITACNPGTVAVGNACLPMGCSLKASIGGFSAPTGANPSGGSITVHFDGSGATPPEFKMNPDVGTRTLKNAKYILSDLPQGNYTITVTDSSGASGCAITLQKTLRVGGFFPDPVLARGSLYCDYQGYPGGPLPPSCPDDSDVGWDETSYNASTNLRKCKYTFKCDPPDSLTVLAPPIGDGQTPACNRVLTACPNTDPPTPPPNNPWIQISSSPLTCKFRGTAPISPPKSMRCSDFGSFYAIPASVLSLHPDVQEWADPNTADPKHIVCF